MSQHPLPPCRAKTVAGTPALLSKNPNFFGVQVECFAPSKPAPPKQLESRASAILRIVFAGYQVFAGCFHFRFRRNCSCNFLTSSSWSTLPVRARVQSGILWACGPFRQPGWRGEVLRMATHVSKIMGAVRRGVWCVNTAAQHGNAAQTELGSACGFHSAGAEATVFPW
jgi:hypothetical protein